MNDERTCSCERPEERGREVLEFDHGVRAHEPAPGGYWRIRWEEAGRCRESTARDRAAAIAKADEIVERLGVGADTSLARAKGADLVAHYLDADRDMPRDRPWSIRHREAQESYCRRFVVPEIAPIECRRLTRSDFQRVLDRAGTKSSADHLRRCLTALANAGLEAGFLLARQDVMRGVRWKAPESAAAPQLHVVEDGGEWAVPVTDDEIPTHEAVHAIARAAATRGTSGTTSTPTTPPARRRWRGCWSATARPRPGTTMLVLEACIAQRARRVLIDAAVHYTSRGRSEVTERVLVPRLRALGLFSPKDMLDDEDDELR